MKTIMFHFVSHLIQPASKPPTLRNTVFHEVRPVAAVDPLIVCQARSAGLVFGLTVHAQGVVSLTCTIGVDAKGILTDSIVQRNHCKVRSVRRLYGEANRFVPLMT